MAISFNGRYVYGALEMCVCDREISGIVADVFVALGWRYTIRVSEWQSLVGGRDYESDACE